jgi:TonB family protein
VPQETTIPFYWWFYLAGILFFVFRLVRQTWMVIQKLKKTGYVKNGPVKLVRTHEYAASFSFFSFVFVNPSTTDVEMKEIVNHESGHIQQRHWFDLLLVELLCMLQWFNPFVWVYSRLVRQNHEYLADQMALQRTSDPAIYHATLLNQMLGAPVISLANSFSYSLNKKRFKMMKKTIESPFRKLKVLLVLPLVAFVFYAFAKPEYVTPINDQTDNPVIQVNADKEVKGQVIRKSDGKPWPGTSVIVKGTTMGTMSDPDGNFTLVNVPENAELFFSFVGMKTVVEKAVFDQPMKIYMEVSTIGLEQITVVGYMKPPPPPPPAPKSGSYGFNDPKNPPLCYVDGVLTEKSKFDIILNEGVESVTVWKGKEALAKFGKKGENGAIEVVTKKFTTTSDSKSKAAPTVTFNPPPPPPPPPPAQAKNVDEVLNTNSKNPPYVILDGVPLPDGKMDQVKPDDIQSISVLKDKSATAIYGEKGKNGVILITSKKKGFQIRTDGIKPDPIYLVDGVEVSSAEVKNIDPNRIESINVLKGDNAVKNFGEKGRDGVIMINLKGSTKVDTSKIRIGFPLDQKIGFKSAIGTNPGEPKDLDDVKVIGYGIQKPQGEKEVFVVVEEMPEFPGGSKALRSFLAQKIMYPVEAQKEKIQGKVFVNFIVGSFGQVTNAKIVKSVHPSLDAEALRVVGLLPAWKPGKQRGQAVDVSYTVPIEFVLQ